MPDHETDDLTIDELIAEIGRDRLIADRSDARDAARLLLLKQIAEEKKTVRRSSGWRRRTTALLLPLILIPVAVAGASGVGFSGLGVSGIFVAEGSPPIYSMDPIDPAMQWKIRKELEEGRGVGAPITDEMKAACRTSLENPSQDVRTKNIYIEGGASRGPTPCRLIEAGLSQEHRR